MRNLLYSVIFLSLGLFSCGDDDVKSNIPYVSFHFMIDLNYLDKHLNESAGNTCVYLTREVKSEYDKLLTDNEFVKTYTVPRAAIDNGNPGYSGLLVVNTGIPDETIGKPLCAFDLCCPQENQQDIRVVPEAAFKVKCPKCGNVFNLQTNGTSETKDGLKLRQYRIKAIGNNEFQIAN